MELRIKQEVINRQNRFVIVDEKDNIVNNANGYGFKTKKSAHKAIYYMNNKKQIEKKKRNIENLYKENKSFKECLELYAFEIFYKGSWGGPEDFSLELVEQTIENYNIDLSKYNLTSKDILKDWIK